ncbi:MAG: prepilin-type N-terminal cleavage/methylation domain-containing protein [Candidatus Peribacteria bacterium]|jgi:prepilin-type N-terminal cleavage/methylation domain-containing protein|nr:prepilin-type N-terminal cleavage/methylation domain-containing protein [Candidatus Peribacteria bacterium]
MNSLNFARKKHSPLNKGRQEGIFNKTLIPNHSPFERRKELGEIVKNPPTPFIKGEMCSFPSPLRRGFTLVEIIVVVTILAIL